MIEMKRKPWGKKKIVQRVFKNFVTGLRAMGRQILFEQGCRRSRQYLQFTNSFGRCGENVAGIQGGCLCPNVTESSVYRNSRF